MKTEVKRTPMRDEVKEVSGDVKAQEVGLDGRKYFDGYASTFGVWDSYDDVVVPGAFKTTIEERFTAPMREGKPSKVTVRYNHGPVLGTLTDLHEDGHGLKFTARGAPIPLADEVHALVKDQAVSQCSFGFRTVDAVWCEDLEMLEAELKPHFPEATVRRLVDEARTKWWPRVVKAVKLFEVTVCPNGANDDTVVYARSADGAIQRSAPVTDFPEAGDDETVCLKSSRFAYLDEETVKEWAEKFPAAFEGRVNLKAEKCVGVLRGMRAACEARNEREEYALRTREAVGRECAGSSTLDAVLKQVEFRVLGTKGKAEMEKILAAKQSEQDASKNSRPTDSKEFASETLAKLGEIVQRLNS